MREGIYVGNKEVTKRYIGNSLVWEKMKLLFSGKVALIYSAFTRSVSIVNQDLSLENAKVIEINGHKIEISKVTKGVNASEFKFVDSTREFERKTNFKRSTPFYEGIDIKVYGGE